MVESTDDSQPILAACMGCGDKQPVLPYAALADTDWKYHFEFGWYCKRCSRLDLRLRRGPGHPMRFGDR